MILEQVAERVGGQVLADPSAFAPSTLDRIAFKAAKAKREQAARQLLQELQSLAPDYNVMVWNMGLEQEHSFEGAKEQGTILVGRAGGFHCAVFSGAGWFENKGNDGVRNWIGTGLQLEHRMTFVEKIVLDAEEPARDDVLVSGGKLLPGEALISANRRFALTVNKDGSLAVERRSGQKLWESCTAGRGPCRHLVLEEHGNLVAYRDDGKPFWDTLTWDLGVGPYQLVMQSDGNLVLYDVSERVMWDTGTSPTDS